MAYGNSLIADELEGDYRGSRNCSSCPLFPFTRQTSARSGVCSCLFLLALQACLGRIQLRIHPHLTAGSRHYATLLRPIQNGPYVPATREQLELLTNE